MPALHQETDDTDVIGKIKEALIQRIGSDRYGLWFHNGVRFRLESGVLVVEVNGDFALQRLRKNFFQQLQSATSQAHGKLSNVRLELAPTPATTQAAEAKAVPSDEPASPPQSSKPKPPELRVRSNSTNDPQQIAALSSAAIDAQGRSPQTETADPGPAQPTSPASSGAMTFANFAAGNSNQLAHTAAQMLAAQPGDAAPICFWGATGTGKTHLLNAIRHDLRHRHRMQRVILMSAEDFTNDFMTAVRGGTGLPTFRKRYRDVDALLIDNIQFFGGKSATLREVLYTVDTIISRRRPLVLAGDRPPLEIDGLSPELAGRMSSGLVCGLNPLEIEVRCELLRRESLRSFMPWDEDLILSLAQRIGGDGRLIQGIGRLVSMLQRMYRRMPTMQEILREAGDLLRRGSRSVAIADIERAVCTAFSLPAGELRSDAKSRNVSQPRILAMYLARQHTRAAYSEIGRYFGDRNHSTVIAAYRRAETWLQSNQAVGGRGKHGIKVQEAIETVENLLRIG